MTSPRSRPLTAIQSPQILRGTTKLVLKCCEYSRSCVDLPNAHRELFTLLQATQKRIGESKVIAARAEVDAAKLMRQAADVS